MAEQSGKPTETIFDVPRLLEALKRIAAENAPIHSAVAAIHNQSKSQATPYNYRLPE